MPKGSPGKPKSPEQKEKMRLAAIARYANKANREEQSTRMKTVFAENPNARKMHTKEARQKQGATLTKLWKTDEYRDNVLVARSSPEVVAALRVGARNQWANSESRAVLVTAMNTPEVKTQRRNAAIRAWATPEMRERMMQRYLLSVRKHLTPEGQANIDNPEWLREQNTQYTLTEIAETINCSPSFVSQQFSKHSIIPIRHQNDYAGGEQKVLDFLVGELGIVDVIHRTYTMTPPYEIDVYLPAFNLGIEYHGLYWHSYGYKECQSDKQRHLKKHEAASSRGIRLLQFWEHEWSGALEGISRSIIRTLVGQSTRLGARDCTVGMIAHTEAQEFLRENHIQGERPFTFAAGLYHANELVMVMTVGRSRYVSGAWELLRLATKKNLTVAGGAQRLWAALREKLPAGVVVHSYADRRLFTGRIYPQLGFMFSHNTPPGYHYCLNGKLYSRLQFQKHKQAKLLSNFDPTLTEAENMFAHGYRRVWDAGQSVWTYQHPK